MRIFLTVFLVAFFSVALRAQMYDPVLQDTLYGNEWIDFDHPDRYYKIEVAADGMYRIPQSALPAAASEAANDEFRIYHNGREIPLYVTDDYLQFYGKRNRSELDEYLFMENARVFNPEYSLFTDTSAYFLTWADTPSEVRFNTVTNDLTDLPAAETSFLHREIFVETNNIHKMNRKQGNISLVRSFFDDGEGFGQGATSDTDYTRTFALDGIVNVGIAPVLTVRYAGNNDVNHLQTFSVNGSVLLTEDFESYEFRNTEIDLPVDLEQDAELFINFLPAEEAASRMTVASAAVNYTRDFDLAGAISYKINLPASAGKRYLEIINFGAEEDVFVYDLTNNLRIAATADEGLLKIVLPPSATERELLLLAETAAVNTVTAYTQTTFTDYFSDNSEFIIISHPALYFDQNGVNQVQAYADYRSGRYISEVVDINQLYDQFSYDIKRTPLSIRNFAYFTQKHNDNAKYFFLIGNAREYNEVRTDEELTNSAFFVPTYGAVGSDNLLFGTPDVAAPIYPLGRLTAQRAEDVKVYLDKVQEIEATYDNPQTVEDRMWMKNVIHMGGGSTDSEQAAIRTGLQNMENTLENNMFGAVTHTFLKTSSDVIEESPREAIEKVVNEGLAILNFFGHSSPAGFDYPIQSPSEFDNQGRYFLMISNGCFSGRCHRDVNGIGENFLFEPGKGAIAYYASNGYGYISALSNFTNNYYAKLGGEYYGQGVGDIFRAVVLDYAAPGNGYSGLGLLTQQNTLQGDPSVRLYPHEGPDLIPETASVAVSPALINTQLPSFRAEVDVVNIGKYIPDSINVKLRQVYPNGEQGYVTEQRIAVPASRQTVTFDIPIDGNNPDVVGLNTIFVTVDSNEEYTETPGGAESNNELRRESGENGFEILIVSNDVLPVIPKEYGITNDADLELIASTVDIFAEQQNFVMQIDTTQEFNSPLFREQIINQSGGLLKWKPQMNWQDDVVYYWRTSPEPENGNFRWNSSSFLYLEEAEDGWNQSHYDQFKEAEFNFVEIGDNEDFKYVEDFKEVTIENGFNRYLETNDLNNRSCIRINNVGQQCGTSQFIINRGVRVYELDSITLDPVPNPADNGRLWRGFETDNFEGREALIYYLRDSIQVGNYVAFITIQKYEGYDYRPEEWAADSVLLGTNIFQILEDEGADIVRDLAELGARPYTFFYKKGYPDVIGGEAMAPPLPGEAGSTFSAYSAAALYTTGSVSSLKIGPATDWNTFVWDMETELEEGETTRLDIYGLRNNGERDTLFTDVAFGSTDLSSVEPTVYPRLQFEWFSADTVLRSAPQLEKWRVFYRGIPEVALNPQAALEISADTLWQGETYSLKIGVENIGLYDTDSLLVKFLARDADNDTKEYLPRYRPLPAGDTLTASVNINTRGLAQLTSLLVDVNPNDDQPEQTHINNTGLLNFYVRADTENPLLDVTFDGVHILNGDLVSPTPQIVISFTDENEFLAMEDTSQFRLTVVYPDRSERRVYFNQPEVLFTPADASNLSEENKAVIEYTPEFTEDGIYTLRVEGQDASGNKSGDLEYSIEFEIITKSMISNVLNYPNPFSTSTRFVYTLTGNEAPTFFKIQIMTVSGRIVREITQNELGEMKIGTHQTDFVWDGTDEFGDKLANGVYLYRITAKNAAGQDIERYESEADRFFNQGFGKMVIIR